MTEYKNRVDVLEKLYRHIKFISHDIFYEFEVGLDTTTISAKIKRRIWQYIFDNRSYQNYNKYARRLTLLKGENYHIDKNPRNINPRTKNPELNGILDANGLYNLTRIFKKSP